MHIIYYLLCVIQYGLQRVTKPCNKILLLYVQFGKALILVLIPAINREIPINELNQVGIGSS